MHGETEKARTKTWIEVGVATGKSMGVPSIACTKERGKGERHTLKRTHFIFILFSVTLISLNGYGISSLTLPGRFPSVSARGYKSFFASDSFFIWLSFSVCLVLHQSVRPSFRRNLYVSICL